MSTVAIQTMKSFRVHSWMAAATWQHEEDKQRFVSQFLEDLSMHQICKPFSNDTFFQIPPRL
jgi:hypothetical protein